MTHGRRMLDVSARFDKPPKPPHMKWDEVMYGIPPEKPHAELARYSERGATVTNPPRHMLACGVHKWHEPHTFHYADMPTYCDGRPAEPVALPVSAGSPEQVAEYRRGLEGLRERPHVQYDCRCALCLKDRMIETPDYEALAQMDPRTLPTNHLIGLIDFLWENR